MLIFVMGNPNNFTFDMQPEFFTAIDCYTKNI